MTMDELILRHAELKSYIASRDQMRKELMDQVEAELKTEWGDDLDERLEELRKEIREFVGQLPGQQYVSDVGQAIIEDRQLSWEVVNFSNLARWIVEHGRANDLLKIQKGQLNKVCFGMEQAGMDLPHGVAAKLTPVLEVMVGSRSEIMERKQRRTDSREAAADSV